MTHKIKLHTYRVKCGSGVILGMRVTNGYFWDNGIRTHQTEDKTVTFGFGYVYINIFFFLFDSSQANGICSNTIKTALRRRKKIH